MGTPVIVSAVRTPIGRAHRGRLVDVDVRELGALVVREAVGRAGIAATDLEDIALGEVLQGGGNVARYVANDLGLLDVPGLAVQRHCASGMQGLTSVAADIAAGMIDVAVAGGAESMSRSPRTFDHGVDPASDEAWISPSHPDRPDAPNLDMVVTVGENTAREAGVTREAQDAWALASHERAIAATDDGRFTQEVVPVELPSGGAFRDDEHPRRGTTLERLAALPPLVGEGGTVTAGNASGINDGAAAMVVADEDWARERGLPVLARVRAWASIGIDPRLTGLAPTRAVPKALARAGLRAADVDLVEINEAFASMAVASSRRLGFPHHIVNVNGGAIGLGHPVACSGARIVVTLVHELHRRGGGIGVATLCAGGGMGAATVLEVPT
jgi:acetyl-CoA C-acetyltransferase